MSNFLTPIRELFPEMNWPAPTTIQPQPTPTDKFALENLALRKPLEESEKEIKALDNRVSLLGSRQADDLSLFIQESPSSGSQTKTSLFSNEDFNKACDYTELTDAQITCLKAVRSFLMQKISFRTGIVALLQIVDLPPSLSDVLRAMFLANGQEQKRVSNQENKYQEALDLIEKVIKEDPTFLPARWARGKMLQNVWRSPSCKKIPRSK